MGLTKKIIIATLKPILKIIFPINKKIIIFWSDYRSFNENSKYLYLYLIKKSLKPMWVTESNEVFEYLKSKKLPVIKRNIF